MKKSLIAGLLVVLAACGYASHDQDENHNAPLAKIQDVKSDTFVGCTNENVHSHDGVNYSGHYNGDGHEHQGHGLKASSVCTVANCQNTNLHQHNGTHYAGHSGSCRGGNHHR